MQPDFYTRSGGRISPGDIFDSLPHARVPKPLRIARKVTVGLPPKVQAKITGELREVFSVTIPEIQAGFEFSDQGEEILSRAKLSRAIFMTWGSEVDADTNSQKLDSKDWLIAPLFPLKNHVGKILKIPNSGETIDFAEAIRTGKSARYFPLRPIPGDAEESYFVDFKKICTVAASHCIDLKRTWQLAPAALNDFYSHLLWFFTRKRIFFSPVACRSCGREVDLGVTFEGQPLDGEEELGG
jgi:hypothetical protein